MRPEEVDEESHGRWLPTVCHNGGARHADGAFISEGHLLRSF
jgi:hypothetical protein